MNAEEDQEEFISDFISEVSEEEWSFIEDYQWQLQDCISFLFDALEDKKRSIARMHSDSQLAHLARMEDAITSNLKTILQKRKCLQFHGDLSEGKALQLVTVILDFEGVALEEICLVDSHLSSNDDVDSLVALLLKNQKTIKTVKLSGSFCDSVLYFERFMSSIYDCNIELLQLGVPFSVTLQYASDFLKHNKSLKDLDINHLTLLEDEVDLLEEIADVLQKNQMLQKFTLFDCTICDQAMTIVGRIIKENRFINYLDLGSLTTSQTGMLTLCDALKENSTLEYLFLDRIRDKTILSYLVNSLKSNNSLLLHNDHVIYGDTLVKNPEIREIWRLNKLNLKHREKDAVAFLHVARKLLLLDNLPMELKLNVLYILLADQFPRTADKHSIVNAFCRRDSIGNLTLMEKFKYSARILISQSYILS